MSQSGKKISGISGTGRASPHCAIFCVLSGDICVWKPSCSRHTDGDARLKEGEVRGGREMKGSGLQACHIQTEQSTDVNFRTGSHLCDPPCVFWSCSSLWTPCYKFHTVQAPPASCCPLHQSFRGERRGSVGWCRWLHLGSLFKRTMCKCLYYLCMCPELFFERGLKYGFCPKIRFF